MAYNEFQKAAAKAYEGGEFEHVLEIHKPDDGFEDLGDGLFEFIMHELEDAESKDEALGRIETAISQLNSVSFRLSMLPDQG